MADDRPPFAYPGSGGELGSAAPHGSYGPSEQFGDFAFLSAAGDVKAIRSELAVEKRLS